MGCTVNSSLLPPLRFPYARKRPDADDCTAAAKNGILGPLSCGWLSKRAQG